MYTVSIIFLITLKRLLDINQYLCLREHGALYTACTYAWSLVNIIAMITDHFDESTGILSNNLQTLMARTNPQNNNVSERRSGVVHGASSIGHRNVGACAAFSMRIRECDLHAQQLPGIESFHGFRRKRRGYNEDTIERI